MKKNDGYQKLKKEVLGCYDVFSDFFTKAQISQEGDSFDELKNQAKKIKADQFKLMVAGEAKSGKSTFINAYLFYPWMYCNAVVLLLKLNMGKN